MKTTCMRRLRDVANIFHIFGFNMKKLNYQGDNYPEMLVKLYFALFIFYIVNQILAFEELG